MSTESQELITWLLGDTTGMSSKTMAAIFSETPMNETRTFHPYDPSDFRRCVGLLEAVPSYRAKLPMMEKVSPEWAVLVKNWSSLEKMLAEELVKTPNRGPKLYVQMKCLFETCKKQS